MKKTNYLFLLLALAFFAPTKAQTTKRDSLITEMCKTLKINTHLSDTLRIYDAFDKHLLPYISTFKESQKDSVAQSVFYRFQRNCPEFTNILSRLNPVEGDWESIEKGEMPKSLLSKKTCKKITKHKQLSYLEYNGDKVVVEIKNQYWTDHFLDGTYSKLKFKWIDDCEFELEFIESNNESRMNMSIKGDIYVYRIIEKSEDYYDVTTKIQNQDNHLRFKIYFKD